MNYLSILSGLLATFSLLAGESIDPFIARSKQPKIEKVCEPKETSRPSIYFNASFLYWYVSQEGMDLAANGVWSQPSLQPFLSTNTTTLFQSFDYHPGFQVGLGVFSPQEWELSLNYTWLRGTNNLQKNGPTSPTATAGVNAAANASGTPVWITQNWFLQSTSNNQALIGTSLQSQWKYAIDFLDLLASAPFWQKSVYTLRPLVGLRGAAIRQSLRLGLTEFPSFFEPSLPKQPIFSRNRSQSLGVGPKIGIESRIKLYENLRLEGTGAIDCLWTHFSKITHSEDAASTFFNPGPYRATRNSINGLRAMAELNLGLGWGRFFSCQKYFFDFSASYDFVYLWNQNMMRWQLDSLLTGSSATSSDLMMHGLTLEGRFEF